VAERTEGSIEIEASPQEVFEVICDFESYPEWAEGIRSAEVTSRDQQGRATDVAFEFSAMGFSASYALRYRYADDGTGVSWTTTEASGAVRDVTGEYVLDDRDGAIEVTYRLAVDLAVPLPGFMKRRADRAAIRSALDGLKKRVEG
jgi:ribosome-associated toxin RatA of RatAB toxin-antitoxin module